MRIYVQALELNLTPEELQNAVPEEKRKSLKGGVLQAYTLAHEGVSRPKVLGEGNQLLKWPRAVIRRIAEKIKEGTKFFLGHRIDNANEGRESVGEVVSSFLKEMGGRLSHIIVGHFPNESKVQNMDICSMEADVYTDDENIVGDIHEISGIALASSDTKSPAFPGALRLGTVQCFDESDPNPSQKEKIVTFDEIKAAVRSMNIFPNQLYTVDDLKNDRVFSAVFTEAESLRNSNTKLKEQNAEIQKKSGEVVHELDVKNATALLDTHMKDLTEKQKTFITGRFDPKAIEKLDDDGIKAFIENAKKEFAETAKLFGIEKIEIRPGGKEDEEPSSMEDQALKELGVT